MTSFSILLPAYNEELAIAPVLQSLKRLYPSAEIIVIDDGSTDRTAATARGEGAIVLKHPANAGYGKSVKDGILAATNDVIVLADADGSYAPENIATLLQKFEEGFDMVVGARSGKYYRGSFFKMPARLLLKWLVEFTTGRHIPDINSGLRIFRKSAAIPYFPDLCQGFSFTTTITLIFLLTGKFVTYVPAAYLKRVGHSKVRILRDSLRTLQYVTEVIATYNPLKLFILMTGCLAAVSVACVVGFLIVSDPFFLLLSSIFLMGAVLVFGMGLLAFRLKRSDPFHERA